MVVISHLIKLYLLLLCHANGHYTWTWFHHPFKLLLAQFLCVLIQGSHGDLFAYVLGLLFANTITVKIVTVSQSKRKRTGQRDREAMKDERIHHGTLDKPYWIKQQICVNAVLSSVMRKTGLLLPLLVGLTACWQMKYG